MANMLTRNQIVEMLQAAGVVIEENATLGELRVQYDAVVAQLIRPQEPDANQRPNNENQQPNNQNQQPDANEIALREAQEVSNRARVAQMMAEKAEVDRQLTIMRKKHELLALQRELNEIESRRIDLGVLDAMISKFDGSDAQDITKWIGDLENAF